VPCPFYAFLSTVRFQILLSSQPRWRQTMFCTRCGSACASDDKFCRECGTALVPPEPPATTSTSKLVPLSRYPFLRKRPGEADHAIRYCNVVVEREFASLEFYSFTRRVRGPYKRPDAGLFGGLVKRVRYEVPVLLLTNKRLLFLKSDAELLFWSVTLTSKDWLDVEEAERGQRQKFKKPPMRRNIWRYLSPYWVLDATLNDELDKEFKDSVWPYISNLDNLSMLNRRSEESQYKFHEASSGWTWVYPSTCQGNRTKHSANCCEEEHKRILRPSCRCLRFTLERMNPRPPLSTDGPLAENVVWSLAGRLRPVLQVPSHCPRRRITGWKPFL
jgi:hypothetical protein